MSLLKIPNSGQKRSSVTDYPHNTSFALPLLSESPVDIQPSNMVDFDVALAANHHDLISQAVHNLKEELKAGRKNKELEQPSSPLAQHRQGRNSRGKQVLRPLVIPSDDEYFGSSFPSGKMTKKVDKFGFLHFPCPINKRGTIVFL